MTARELLYLPRLFEKIKLLEAIREHCVGRSCLARGGCKYLKKCDELNEYPSGWSDEFINARNDIFVSFYIETSNSKTGKI